MARNESKYNSWVAHWLTQPRFNTFLKAAGNDTQRALDLYQWNADLNAALLHDIGHFEVFLRNSIDRAFRENFDHAVSWLCQSRVDQLFPPMLTSSTRTGTKTDVNEYVRLQFTKTRMKHLSSRAKADLAPLDMGPVVAALSFGTWVDLVSGRFEKSLWVPYIRHAFSPGTSRKDVEVRLRLVQTVRNRVAHHEPNMNGMVQFQRNLTWLMKSLDPHVQQHVAAHSSIQAVLESRPR